MYEGTRGLRKQRRTTPHEQSRGLEYKSRCKNSWARFWPRAPHVKRAAWVLLREKGITPRMFVTMAFLGATCCPLWLLPRGCIYHQGCWNFFLWGQDYVLLHEATTGASRTRRRNHPTSRPSIKNTGLELEVTKRTVPGWLRGASPPTAAFRWWSLFGYVVCFYNSSNILK